MDRASFERKVECVCVTCDALFLRRRCEVSRFCSHRCYTNSRLGKRPQEVTKPCSRCGKQMTNYVSQIGKYCSKACCDADKRTDTAARFWPRVSKNDGCWLWTSTVDSRGYGKFWVNGKTVHAHRVAYELAYGAIAVTDNRFVCHHCDTPLCCRPDHLFLGTPKDNTADMYRKGRANAYKRKKRAALICLHCGIGYEVIRNTATKRRFCSHRCSALFRWRHD